MAVELVFFSLLLGLTLLIHDAASLCNVTCTTDYNTLLNCSCSGSVPSSPTFIEATCSLSAVGMESMESNGRCEVKPPRSWCVMHPEHFEYMASIGTNCIASAHQLVGHVRTNASESSRWALSDTVKPSQPFNVQVAKGDGLFNVTWEVKNELDEPLNYRVRIRANAGLSKDPVHSLLVDQTFVLIYREKLQPRTEYTVDVQAKLSPQAIYSGPWSEWSSPAEWETAGTSGKPEGADLRWWYMSLPVILVLLVLLGYSQKTIWLKRLQVILFIPKPNDFFKPLYSTHEGNFKDWVRPVFSEYDVQMINTWHHVPRGNKEKQKYREDDETKQDGASLNSSLLHSQEGGSWHGTGHLAGQISIHTVTLSGEEELEGVNVSRRPASTVRGYQDGESLRPYEGEIRAGYDLEDPQIFMQNEILPQPENQIFNDLPMEQAQFVELERVSLDSFVFNEQSEDGYPQVDLDTIDSGYGECSSPAASQSSAAEQMSSNVFHQNSNSNYVKQWMVCGDLREDSSNSTDGL